MVQLATRVFMTLVMTLELTVADFAIYRNSTVKVQYFHIATSTNTFALYIIRLITPS